MQQIPMAVTEGLQMCSVTAWQGPVTGALLLNDSSLPRKTGATWWLQPRMNERLISTGSWVLSE